MSPKIMEGTNKISRPEALPSQVLYSTQNNHMSNAKISSFEPILKIPCEGFRLLPANSPKNQPPEPASKEKSLVEMGFTYDVEDWESIVQPQKENLYCLLRNMILNHVKPNVEVQIGDTSFDCHMMVLQCYSDLFFMECTVESLVLLSKERISADAFRLAYNWMIADKPLVQRESILELLAAAKYLGMKDLMVQCRLCIEDAAHFQESNAFMMFLESKKYDMGDEGVQEIMLGRISNFFLTVVASQELLNLTAEELCLLLSSDTVAVNTEIEIFLTAIRWLLHDWVGREKFMIKIIECVRFTLFPPWFLMTLSKKCEPIMANIVGHSAVVKKIHDAVSYNTANIFYGKNTPQYEKILQHYDLVAPRQRVWIYDEKCEYHRLPGQDDMGSINYKKFEEYLAVIRTMGPDHWRSLKPVEVTNPVAEEQLESRRLGTRIQFKQSHDETKEGSCQGYYSQQNYDYVSSSTTQVTKDGGHTKTEAGSKAQYISTKQGIVIEAFYSQKQSKKTTPNPRYVSTKSEFEKADVNTKQADSQETIDFQPLAPAPSSIVHNAKPSSAPSCTTVDCDENHDKRQPTNHKIPVTRRYNHNKSCPRYGHSIKQKYKASAKRCPQHNPKIESNYCSVSDFNDSEEKPKASSSNVVHITESDKCGAQHRARSNAHTKPSDKIKYKMPSTDIVYERKKAPSEQKMGLHEVKKQIAKSFDRVEPKPSAVLNRSPQKSTILEKNLPTRSHTQDSNHSSAIRKRKKQTTKKSTESATKALKSMSGPPKADKPREKTIASQDKNFAEQQPEREQESLSISQDTPTVDGLHRSSPGTEENFPNEPRSTSAQEAKILESGQIYEEAYEHRVAFCKREKTVGMVSSSTVQELSASINEAVTMHLPEYRNEIKKFELQAKSPSSVDSNSDYEIQFHMPAGFTIQEQKYPSCSVGDFEQGKSLTYPEALTFQPNTSLTTNQLFANAPQIISSIHHSLSHHIHQANPIEESKLATIAKSDSDDTVEENRRFHITQQSQSDIVITSGNEQPMDNMPNQQIQQELQCPAHRVAQEHRDFKCQRAMQHKQDCPGSTTSSDNVSEQSTENSECVNIHGQNMSFAVASYFRTTRHPVIFIFGGTDPYNKCTVHHDKCPEEAKRTERMERQDRKERTDNKEHKYTKESEETGNYGDQVLFYNTFEAKWQHLTFLPFGSRHHHATVTVRGLIYVIGGTRTSMECSKKSMFEKSIWCYNPRTFKWTLESTLPELRRDFAAVPIENQCPDCKCGVGCRGLGPGFFVIGGEGINYTALDTVWFYNVLRKKWTKKASLNAGRYGFAAALVNNQIWIAGGMVGEKCGSPHTEETHEKIGDGPDYNSIEATSVKRDKITSTMECYSLKYGACCNREYGGRGESCFKCIKDCEGHWTKMESRLRVPCLFGKLCKVSNNELYLFGGITYDAKHALVSLRNIDKYDFKAKKWKPCLTLLHARHGHDVVTVSDRIIVIGGVSTLAAKTLTQVETFRLKSNTHIKRTADLPWPLSGVTAVIWNK